MARKRGFFALLGAADVDERPLGALRYADPSTAEFPRHIHTYNEPFSRRSIGENNGIRSVTGSMVPYGDRHTADSWAAMERKKGTLEEDD